MDRRKQTDRGVTPDLTLEDAKYTCNSFFFSPVTGTTASPTTMEMKTVRLPTPGAIPSSPGTTLRVSTS